MQILIIYLHSNHSRRINFRRYIFLKEFKKSFSKKSIIFIFPSKIYFKFSFLKILARFECDSFNHNKKLKIIEKYWLWQCQRCNKGVNFSFFGHLVMNVFLTENKLEMMPWHFEYGLNVTPKSKRTLILAKVRRF
jgi:hypothetical protein